MRSDATRSGGARPVAVFAVLALSASTYALFQSILVPALPEIRRELDASSSSATWLITGYLVSASVATPIAGNLGDLFGRRRVLLATLALCTVGSVIAATAASIDTLIVGRVIQGLAGAVFPLSFGIIRDELPPARVPIAIASISTIMGVGGALGIVLAGPILEAGGYHALFSLPLVLVVAAGIGAALFLPSSPPPGRTRVDWTGAALMSAWLVALLLAISEGPAWGWGSGRQVALLAVALGLFAVWIVAESRSAAPMIDLDLMRSRAVWTTNAAALAYGYCMFTTLVLVPQFVEMPSAAGYGFSATVTEAGLFLVPSTITMVLLGPVSGWICSTAGPRRALMLGASATALSFLVLVLAHDESWHIYGASVLTGAGNALCFGALPNLIVAATPPDRTSTATGMNLVFRNVGGALGSLVAGVLAAGGVASGDLPSESMFVAGFAIGLAAALAALALGVIGPDPD